LFGRTEHLFGRTEHLFVGTQDLCVQSNPTSNPVFYPDGNRFVRPSFVGPGFVGLDAKILRPYKQMFPLASSPIQRPIQCIQQILSPSTMQKYEDFRPKTINEPSETLKHVTKHIFSAKTLADFQKSRTFATCFS
jgi:hypothetical protein